MSEPERNKRLSEIQRLVGAWWESAGGVWPPTPQTEVAMDLNRLMTNIEAYVEDALRAVEEERDRLRELFCNDDPHPIEDVSTHPWRVRMGKLHKSLRRHVEGLKFQRQRAAQAEAHEQALREQLNANCLQRDALGIQVRALREGISKVLGVARQSNAALEISEDAQITMIWHMLQDLLTPMLPQEGKDE